jgi:hypothetical protein
MIQAYGNQAQLNNNFIHINLAYQSTAVLTGEVILKLKWKELKSFVSPKLINHLKEQR